MHGSNSSSSSVPRGAVERYQAEIYRLAEENHRLNSLLAARGGGVKANSSSDGADTDAADPAAVADELRGQLHSSQSTCDRLQSENADLTRKLQSFLAGEPVDVLDLQSSVDNLGKQVWNLRAELSAEQSAHTKMKAKAAAEQDVMLKELERRLQAETLLRSKCRALAAQIEDMQAQEVHAKAAARLGGSFASSGSASSMRGGALRRPTSAGPSPRGVSQGRPLSRPNSRPGLGTFFPQHFPRTTRPSTRQRAHPLSWPRQPEGYHRFESIQLRTRRWIAGWAWGWWCSLTLSFPRSSQPHHLRLRSNSLCEAKGAAAGEEAEIGGGQGAGFAIGQRAEDGCGNARSFACWHRAIALSRPAGRAHSVCLHRRQPSQRTLC